MSYETPMKTTISLKLFSLLTMTFLISTIVFSSEIGTANAQKYSVIATIPVGGAPFGVAINPLMAWYMWPMLIQTQSL